MVKGEKVCVERATEQMWKALKVLPRVHSNSEGWSTYRWSGLPPCVTTMMFGSQREKHVLTVDVLVTELLIRTLRAWHG